MVLGGVIFGFGLEFGWSGRSFVFGLLFFLVWWLKVGLVNEMCNYCKNE